MTAPNLSLPERLQALSGLLDGVRDVLAARVSGPEAPAWVVARGWAPFLEELGEAELEACEEHGLERVIEGLPAAPATLRELARALRAACELPSPDGGAPAPPRPPRVPLRKTGQVASLVALCRRRFPACRRLVDVGAGHGHLTRELALALGLPAVGIEQDPGRVAVARQLAGAAGPRFEAAPFDPTLRPLEPDDLVVGLHACGALGDALVVAAARAGAAALLVGCCLQKVPGAARAPISAAGRRPGLAFEREVLGLSNLVSRGLTFTGSAREVLEGRALRHGLRLLLRARGLDLDRAPGPGPAAQVERLRGLDRRLPRQGLERVAALACARFGLQAPAGHEVEAVTVRARAEFQRMRRWSLPRAMLGRPLELAVALDRACHLEEAGQAVAVERVFPDELSPRNVGVLARIDHVPSAARA